LSHYAASSQFVPQITDAQKTNVNSTSPYITYLIRTGDAEARHRYSEFESLRENLLKLYPTLIIPPIPSKQSISDYAVKQSKAKEDASMIAQRKRMLQTFLNRLARHPILSNEHVFHRFLDGEVSWVRPFSLTHSHTFLTNGPPAARSINIPPIVCIAQEHAQGSLSQSRRFGCFAGLRGIAKSVCCASST
jgi:hypothetical protein